MISLANKWKIRFTSKQRLLIMRRVWRLPADHRLRTALTVVVGYGHNTVRIDLRQVASDDVVALDEVLELVTQRHTRRSHRSQNAIAVKRHVVMEFLALGVVDRLALVANG